MKKGMEVSEFAQSLIDNREKMHDYLINTGEGVRMILNRSEDQALGNHVLHFESEEAGDSLYRIKDTAHSQIAQHTKIGSRYYNRLLEEDSKLLEENVNYWFEKNPVNRTLRTLWDGAEDKTIRAFLSDRYKRLDNYDVANATLPIIQENGAKIESCNITDDHMYIKAIAYEKQREVKVGDAVSLGVSITNSETGRGAVDVSVFLYRLVCDNGMKVMDKLFSNKNYHVGKVNAIEGMSLDKAYQLYSDETKEMTEKAFFMQLQDTVRGVFNDEAFTNVVEALNKGTHIDMSTLAGSNPIEMVKKLSKSMAFNQDEEASILKHFLQDEDNSQWGLANAITRTAQDLTSYDRATEFEGIGWNIATMSESRLHGLVAVA